MIIYKIGSDGFLEGQKEVNDHSIIPEGFTTVLPVLENEDGSFTGFYKPKWNEGTWIEGATAEEIQAIINAPRQKTQLEILQETVDELVLANLMGGI